MSDVIVSSPSTEVIVESSYSDVLVSGGVASVNVSVTSSVSENTVSAQQNHDLGTDVYVSDASSPHVEVGAPVMINLGGEVALSTDAGNVIKKGTDGGLYVQAFSWKTTQW